LQKEDAEMVDQTALDYYKAGNIVGLIQYVEPMWMVVALKTIEDLTDSGCGFYPSSDRYRSQITSSGRNVSRATLLFDTVALKRGRLVTWGKFWEMKSDDLAKLPQQQVREIREFWKAGSRPGLEGPGNNPPAKLGGGDWFLTSFGGQSSSVVATVGFSQMTGTIGFTRADGTAVTKSIGIIGPSIGVSKAPSFASIPGVGALAQRFPTIGQFIRPDMVGPSEALMKFLFAAPTGIAKIVWAMPGVVKALDSLATSPSLGPSSLPSPAIGMVAGGGRVVSAGDFSGTCLMFAANGTAAVGNATVCGLFFGFPSTTNPVKDLVIGNSKGMSLFSAASISAQMPQLGVTFTVYWGEII
jgi:hypothetical protein